MEKKNNEMVEVKNSTLSNNESEMTMSNDRFNEIFKELKDSAVFVGKECAETDDWNEDECNYDDCGYAKESKYNWVNILMDMARDFIADNFKEEEELFWEKFEEDEKYYRKELAEAAAIAYAKEKDCDWDWFGRNYEEMVFTSYNNDYDRGKYTFSGYWGEEKEFIFNHLVGGGILLLNEQTVIDGTDYDDSIEDTDALYERTIEIVDEFFNEDNEDIEELDSDQQFWRSTEEERSWMTGGDKLNQGIQDMWESGDCDKEDDAPENCGIYGDILRIIF